MGTAVFSIIAGSSNSNVFFCSYFKYCHVIFLSKWSFPKMPTSRKELIIYENYACFYFSLLLLDQFSKAAEIGLKASEQERGRFKLLSKHHQSCDLEHGLSSSLIMWGVLAVSSVRVVLSILLGDKHVKQLTETDTYRALTKFGLFL